MVSPEIAIEALNTKKDDSFVLELQMRHCRVWGGFSREKLHLMALPDAVEGLHGLADELMLQLTTAVLGQTLETKEATAHFEFPATWWQHFKQRNFPSWLKGWYPVRMRTHERIVKYEIDAIYPKADIDPNTLGPPVLCGFPVCQKDPEYESEE